MPEHHARPEPDPTAGEVIEKYLHHSERTGRHAPKSRLNVEQVLRAFAAACGPLRAAEAKGYHLTDFIEGRPTWKSDGMRATAAKRVKPASIGPSSAGGLNGIRLQASTTPRASAGWK
jgi:hypothetical protein